MGLCGSFRCGCGVTSTPAVAGAINGELPSIYVSGSGEAGDPYDLQLNDAWAAEVAGHVNDTARGVIASVTISVNQTGITSQVDVTGGSITFTAEADRLYRISFCMDAYTNVAGDQVLASVADSSNVQKLRALDTFQVANSAYTLTAFRVESGLSGSITRKLRIWRIGGTGTVVIDSNSTPTTLVIEDLGLA